MKKIIIDTLNGAFELDEKYILFIKHSPMDIEYHLTKEFYEQSNIRMLKQARKITIVKKNGTRREL
jgi:hypothetical protein